MFMYYKEGLGYDLGTFVGRDFGGEIYISTY